MKMWPNSLTKLPGDKKINYLDCVAALLLGGRVRDAAFLLPALIGLVGVFVASIVRIVVIIVVYETKTFSIIIANK